VFSLKAGAGVQARLAAPHRPEFRWVLDAAEERRRSQIIFSLRDAATQ